MRASLVIPIKFLAMHAVDAFVDVDMPFRVYRLNRALVGAALARPSALRPALQPFKHPDATWDGKCSPKRTEIPAEESFDK
jgi:hypothetical protein